MADGSLITTDGQVEWRGLLLGDGTAFGIASLTGWLDLPGQRGGNPEIPSRHGAYTGRLLSTSRVITLDFKTKRVNLPGFRAAVGDLRRVTAPDEDPQEEPLVVRLDGETWMVWARCTRRIIPTDKHYVLGYTEGSLQWEAADPRLYSVNEMRATAPLPAPPIGGLDFGLGGLDFSNDGLDFGEGRSGGLIRALNSGDVPTWPVLEISGPVTGPIVTFGNGRTLAFDPTFQVLEGQTLVIDTKPGVRTVEVNGVSVRPRLFTRGWTPLAPGVDTDIRFTAADYFPEARLVVRWRHAKH